MTTLHNRFPQIGFPGRSASTRRISRISRSTVCAISMCLAFYVSAQEVKPAPAHAIVTLSADFERLAQTVGKSVVQVNVAGYAVVPDASDSAFVSREQGTGSGVILSSDGFIMTNAHVVRGAQSVTVTLAPSLMRGTDDEGMPIPAKVIGVDSETDLALLHIPRKGLPPLELANSSHVRQGQIALAFGSPLGLANSLTMGVISSPLRQLSPEDFMEYIQTDTPINPGNSGGPLVSADGRVIGINTMIMSQSGGNEGIGFAIPSNLVRDVYQQLRKSGRVRRGLLGVAVQNLDPKLRMGLSISAHSGAIVSDVEPNGPADHAGLKIGDVVISLDGVPIRNARQFELAIFRSAKGSRHTIEVLRGDETLPLSAEMGEREIPSDRLSEISDLKKQLIEPLGVLGVAITKDIAPLLGSIRLPNGVVVTARVPEATSAAIDLRPGDIIHSVNGLDIADLETLQSKLNSFHTGDAVVLQVERDGRLTFVAYITS
ncbi:MAG: trypsin-like peptidase domain-containing protein [Bryobacterales bacterium]|nr:trypsin-like peptidase domain-containing protein [Bryobacterales bacterium]